MRFNIITYFNFLGTPSIAIKLYLFCCNTFIIWKVKNALSKVEKLIAGCLSFSFVQICPLKYIGSFNEVKLFFIKKK